jgi:hypothetical protein
VCYVGKLGLAGVFDDEVNNCWNIISTHLFEGPLPKFFLIWGEGSMAHTISGSSVVAKPDVVACVDYVECGGSVS